MKGFMTFILFIILTLLLMIMSACNDNNTKRDPEAQTVSRNKIVIGVTLQDVSNEFITMLHDALLEKVKDYPNVELIINDAEAKPDKQVAQMESFITQRVNAIIINPVDANVLIPSVENAVKLKIPVITLSSDIAKEVGQTWSGSENIKAGEIEAQFVVDELKGKGNVAIIRGPVGHLAEIERYEGYRKVIDKYPNIKIVFDQTGNWQREQAMAIMETCLESGIHVDAVLSQNDAMMLGALKAIEDAGERGKIVTAGIDAIGDALDAVKYGKLDATCFQDSKGQAYGAVEMAIKAASGEKIKPNIIPFELVTKSNVENYYNKIKIK